jgi:putative acetyltransferase
MRGGSLTGPPDGTLIRSFTEADAAALWAVYYSAIHETAAADYTAEQIDAWAPAEFDLSRWTERMRGISPFVAERNGEVVGYADLQPTGYIDHFFVSAAVNRRGIGSLLMQRILETAQSRGMESLFADVSVTARPFFEAWGFKAERSQSVSTRGVELLNYRMRLVAAHLAG